MANVQTHLKLENTANLLTHQSFGSKDALPVRLYVFRFAANSKDQRFAILSKDCHTNL